MRHGMRFRILPLGMILLPLLMVPSAAQQIRFIPDFSVPVADRVYLNGSSFAGYQSNIVLRLTDGSANAENTSAWFTIPQPVNQGFTTYFAFQVHNPIVCCNPGDGFAFVIQNSTSTNSSMGASGSGFHAVGAGWGGLGYAGINDSLAVEFDIYQDPWDPSSNHVAVQTCGGNPANYNTPVHLPGNYTLGSDHNVTSCLLGQTINNNIPTLGPACSGGTCTDGSMHQVVIEYTPPTGGNQGVLQVYLDPTFQPGTFTPVNGSVPVLNTNYNLVYSSSNPLGLVLANTNQLLVGFTGSQPASQGATMDILAWQFTTHSPTQVTQIIPPGGTEADYTFGGHQMGVTYPSGFNNPNNITMTVQETPENQQTFYTQRLQGTQFANENCIIYLGTGGNCILYSVTCHDQNGNQITCPSETDPTIAICTQFTTSQYLSQINTDFLEAEPIGSNNWCSIWSGFNNNNDPVVSGKGRGFSDIVATLSPTGPGMSCQSLQHLTEKMVAAQPVNAQNQQPQGGGFCPKVQ